MGSQAGLVQQKLPGSRTRRCPLAGYVHAEGGYCPRRHAVGCHPDGGSPWVSPFDERMSGTCWINLLPLPRRGCSTFDKKRKVKGWSLSPLLLGTNPSRQGRPQGSPLPRDEGWMQVGGAGRRHASPASSS